MAKEGTLSTIIDAGVKEAITRFCKERGLKLRYLIEEALMEQLEDAVDLEAYHDRRYEKTIPISIVARRKKKGSKSFE